MLAFSDPVHQSQAVFRELLDAMAHPGRVVEVSATPALEAVALTLFDADVSVWMPDDEPRRRWLQERCGCKLSDTMGDAAFALVSAGAPFPPLDRFACGTPLEPQASATLVLGVRALRGGARVTLHGPGIDGETTVSPAVPPSFWKSWRENARRAPLGVDVLLVSETAVLALPRTVQVPE